MTKCISGCRVKQRAEQILITILYISTAMTCILLLFSAPYGFIRPYIFTITLLGIISLIISAIYEKKKVKARNA
jgi:uncharacterized membrane protein YccC